MNAKPPRRPCGRPAFLPPRASVLAAALAACAGARASPPEVAHPPPPARTIRVLGDGRATAKPDVAVVTLGVESLAPKLAAASQRARDDMARVLEVLDRAGVRREDAQTTSFHVSIERRADREGRSREITGYRVVNQAQAKVRDLGRLGAILDAVVAAGANAVQGITFEKGDPSPERSRARAAAVAAGRAKAEELARAAGVRLGEVLEIRDVAGPSPVPMEGFVARAVAAEVPVRPGELEFAAQVELVYAIAP